MKKLITLSLSVLFFSVVQAQENPISNSTLTTCGGFLVDTGLSAGDYGNNENFTMTVCAEAPETIINLYFNLFQLGTGDSMTIYDGDDTSAPLIGMFEEDDLQTTDVTSTGISGCLTIVWVTHASDIGNFTAETTCGLPCERPVVAVDVASDNPWRICVDEEISLDGSPTTFADGTALESFTWDFGDNTTNTTDWPIVTHSFSAPGAYLVQLYVTDDNECSNGNLIDVLVEVSTTPDFSETTEDLLLCLGQELELNGAVTPVEWSASPSSNFGGALFIPDDQTQCFGSEIIVSGFSAGQEVTQVSDLVDFFINFEHSFMGDLTITFLCPSGQSIIAHAQGGGGTFLGEPVDNDGTPDIEGVGYDYYWAPDATLGTWDDESGGTLASDIYSTVGDWDDLIGCPLNGIWSIEICDSWGSDNGFIFDWAVTFDPSLYPEDLSFTPSIGADCDSTFWSSNNGPLSTSSVFGN